MCLLNILYALKASNTGPILFLHASITIAKRQIYLHTRPVVIEKNATFINYNWRRLNIIIFSVGNLNASLRVNFNKNNNSTILGNKINI